MRKSHKKSKTSTRTKHRMATAYGKRASVLECSRPLELWPGADIANERENVFVAHAPKPSCAASQSSAKGARHISLGHRPRFTATRG
jgi:hypothetical protein